MSKYTMQLREIAELLTSEKYPDNTDFSYKNIIALSNPLLFDFDYPIFDNEYKNILQTKFLKHFYQREIGSETIGQFILKLDEKFNLIMPYYNMLYNQGIENLNLFKTSDMNIEHSLTKEGTTEDYGQTSGSTSGQTSGQTSDSTTTSNNNINKFSDTPQGTISNVESATYLTDVRIVTDGGTSSNSGSTSGSSSGSSSSSSANTQTVNSTDTYIEHRFGFEGLNPIDQIQKIQNTFFNIDLMILNKCEDLFIKLW